MENSYLEITIKNDDKRSRPKTEKRELNHVKLKNSKLEDWGDTYVCVCVCVCVEGRGWYLGH